MVNYFNTQCVTWKFMKNSRQIINYIFQYGTRRYS